MNDADNNNTDHDAKVDQEAGLSKTEYAKPTKNTRTSDIYERFLNRVQSIDSDNNNDNVTNDLESLDTFKESSTYELLNEEELRLFANHEQEIDPEQEVDSNESNFTSIDISFSNDEVTDYEEPSTNLSESSVDSESTHGNDNLASEPEIERNSGSNSSTKKTAALWGRPASNGKLLIIGGFCGLLLSALVVVTLNATGFLAASTDSLAPNSIQTVPANTPVANSEQSVDEKVTTKADNSNDSDKASAGTEISTKTASSDTLSADATTSDSKLKMDAKTVSSKDVPAQSASKQNEVKNNSTNNSTVTETDISPDDFREEAQTTLYRETKD